MSNFTYPLYVMFRKPCRMEAYLAALTGYYTSPDEMYPFYPGRRIVFLHETGMIDMYRGSCILGMVHRDAGWDARIIMHGPSIELALERGFMEKVEKFSDSPLDATWDKQPTAEAQE